MEASIEHWELPPWRKHAGKRSEAGCDVHLFVSRATNTSRASTATIACDDGDILKEMSPRFAKLYADTGRPSIPPERLLRALLLQILYTVRSERLLMEQLNYNLLFRWFVGMDMDEVVW